MTGSTQFVVGSTYQQLPSSKAPYSRNGTKKVHDVTVFVDFFDDPRHIDRVSFDLGESFSPSTFVHSSPVPVQHSNGRSAWRYATRQQVYGRFNADIRIRGTGGTILDTSHQVSFENTTRKQATFTETRPEKPLRPVILPKEAKFGIELEMSSPLYMTPEQICHQLSQSGIPIHHVDTWSAGRATTAQGEWKLVPDGSIVCSTTMPDCSRFELVSPVLRSGEGLSQTSSVLSKLKQHVDVIKVNRSMGFHVHVDVSRYSHAQLIKICQQFVKYEAAMDRLLPRSRRTNSPESDLYFRSNRAAIEESLSNIHGDDGGGSSGSGTSGSIWDVHNRIGSSRNIHELADVMNPSGRYYKLNLTNLTSGRQMTLEFRQHSSTTNYTKVGAWVRFCFRFCENSAKFPAPKPFKRGRDLDYQLGALFSYVIKDRALHSFYKVRVETLVAGFHDDEDDCCCNECAMGSGGGSGGNSGGRSGSTRKRGLVDGGCL